MKKSVKTKVVSGVLTVGLLSGVGIAFASTDAGTNLQNWYNGQFGKSKQSIVTQTTNYAMGKVPGLNTEYTQLKNDAKTSINGTKSTESTTANGAITTAKTQHLDSLATKKLEIEGKLNSQFDGIQQEADTAIGQAGLLVLDYANKDLTKITGNTGSAALTSLTTELNEANQQAVSELQAAITAAKADLQAQLNAATTSRVESINHIIDKKIDELRTAITQKKDELVAAQQKLIKDKAAELQAKAEADLNSVVGGI